MNLSNNLGRRRKALALSLGDSASDKHPAGMRGIATTIAVMAPVVVIYLALWKFWFTSDFLSNLGAATQSGPVVAGSNAGLFEVIKPSDQLGTILTRYFLGIPIYNTILGSLVPYHVISFTYIGILGFTTWTRLTSRVTMRTVLTRLWTMFGAIWFVVFAMAELAAASIDAYVTVGFVANTMLAIFTAGFLLYSLIRKLRGGDKTAT